MVIVIMSLITLVFLNRQSKFDSSTIMRSLAYSIALSVRQAQVYGISVRSSGPSSGNFSSAHGLYFVSSTPSSYVLFADKDTDKKYTISIDGVDQNFNLNKGYVITEFCAVSSSGKRCTGADDTSGVATISSLSIMFIRPNPDAYVYAFDSLGNKILFGGLPEIFSTAYLQVASLNSPDKRFISITNTGQVSVCALNASLGSAGC